MFVSFFLNPDDPKQGLTQKTHSLFIEIELDIRGSQDNFVFNIACLTSVGKCIMLKILEKINLFSHRNICDYFLAF